jgi:predicted GNAT family N-acyltransferase
MASLSNRSISALTTPCRGRCPLHITYVFCIQRDDFLPINYDMATYTVRLASWRNDSTVLKPVREAVFILEQGISVELEWDGLDAECIHVLAADARLRPIGTARLLPDGTIGRMAVLKEWRRQGVGSALMERLLGEARDRQIREVTLNAQVYVTGFYRKFGFQAMGEEFMEAGIRHMRMVNRLYDGPCD